MVLTRAVLLAVLAAPGPAAAATAVHTTAADFGAGALSSAAVVNAGGGAVRLAASLDEWEALAAPDSRDYYAVHMLSTGTAWAVGGTRGDAHNSYNALRYDGAGWTAAATMANGVELRALWVSAGSEGWAAGDGGRLLGLDGSTWFTEVDYLAPSLLLRGLHMVFNPEGWWEAWAVGASGAILNFDGSGWNPFPSPTTDGLNAVRMASPADGWAVGAAGRILRYDGAAWSAAASPAGETLKGLHLVSGSSGWAVGDSGRILRCDGSVWGTEDSPTGANLAAVWASADEGWAVGDGGTLLRLDDGVWLSTPSPTAEALKGLSCAVPERCLAVGLSGSTLRYRRDYQAAGTFASDKIDGGGSPDWGTLSWTASGLAAGVELKFQISAAPAADDPGLDDFRGPDGTATSHYTASATAVWSGHDGKRYLKYKAFLSTTDALQSPRLESVTVSY